MNLFFVTFLQVNESVIASELLLFASFFLLRKLLSALISFHGDVSLKMKGKDTKGNEGGQLAVCRL